MGAQHCCVMGLLFLKKLNLYLESICCADHYVTRYLAGPSATCPQLNDLRVYLSKKTGTFKP